MRKKTLRIRRNYGLSGDKYAKNCEQNLRRPQMLIPQNDVSLPCPVTPLSAAQQEKFARFLLTVETAQDSTFGRIAQEAWVACVAENPCIERIDAVSDAVEKIVARWKEISVQLGAAVRIPSRSPARGGVVVRRAGGPG